MRTVKIAIALALLLSACRGEPDEFYELPDCTGATFVAHYGGPTAFYYQSVRIGYECVDESGIGYGDERVGP